MIGKTFWEQRYSAAEALGYSLEPCNNPPCQWANNADQCQSSDRLGEMMCWRTARVGGRRKTTAMFLCRGCLHWAFTRENMNVRLQTYHEALPDFATTPFEYGDIVRAPVPLMAAPATPVPPPPTGSTSGAGNPPPAATAATGAPVATIGQPSEPSLFVVQRIDQLGERITALQDRVVELANRVTFVSATLLQGLERRIAALEQNAGLDASPPRFDATGPASPPPGASPPVPLATENFQ